MWQVRGCALLRGESVAGERTVCFIKKRIGMA